MQKEQGKYKESTWNVLGKYYQCNEYITVKYRESPMKVFGN